MMSEKPTYQELEERIEELLESESRCKQLEKSLHLSEERFRQLFENMINGFALHEIILNDEGHVVDYRFLSANPAFEKLTGLKREAILGKTVLTVLPDTEQYWIEKYGQVALTGEPIEFEDYSQELDRHYLVSAYRPAPQQFACIFQDITSRKKAEEKLHETNLKHNEAVRAAKVGLWNWDLETNRVHYSREWKQQIGYEDHEISDDFGEWKSRVHPEDLDQTLEIVNQSIAESKKEHKVEFRFRHKDGSYRWILTQGSILQDKKGNPARMLGSHIDITDLKTAEREALVLKTAIDQAPVGIALADENIQIYYCNPEGLGMRGGHIGDLVEIPKDAFDNWQVYQTNGEPYEIDNLPLVRAIRNGQIVREEFIVKHQDGSDHLCDAVACPVIENGKVVGGIVIFLDITERKKIEDALATSEERLALTLKGSSDAPWDWDLITNELYYSPQWWAQLGYNSDELPADAALWQRLMHPEDAEHVDSVFRGALESGIDNYEVEFRLHHKKGHYVPVLSRGFITRSEDGTPVRVTGTNMDLSERKQAEETLRKSHERLLTVLDSIDASIYVGDMQNHEVLFMNQYMINSFGRDMTGEVCYKAFRGESEKCSYCHNDQLIDADEKPTGVYTWQDQDKVTGKWYINYDRAIEWTDGRLVKIHIASDITEMKHMEEQLRQVQKMESIGTLAGGIAHEFNNMLSIIIGNTELAFDDIPDWNPARDSLNEIKVASLRAKDVVRKLLSVARKTPESRKPIQIGPVISDSVDFIRRTIPATIDIRKNIACSTEMILGDITEINQIVINLFTNSVHAMADESGVLEVDLDIKHINRESALSYEDLESGDYVRLAVKDTGKGIEPVLMDRLFDPYFTTKDVDKGLGMGLAVVHGIVKKHEGAIKIESVVGNGTTVEVLFPLIEAKAGAETEEIETHQVGSGRILMVDDEHSLVQMVTKMLSRSGYEVIGETSSSDALKLFKETPEQFDVVISDIAMPEIAGDRLAKEIKQIRPEVPIILCTGHSERIDDSKAKELGVEAFIMKPYSNKDITKTIQRILNKTSDDNSE